MRMCEIEPGDEKYLLYLCFKHRRAGESHWSWKRRAPVSCPGSCLLSVYLDRARSTCTVASKLMSEIVTIVPALSLPPSLPSSFS